jgi:dihydroorotase
MSAEALRDRPKEERLKMKSSQRFAAFVIAALVVPGLVKAPSLAAQTKAPSNQVGPAYQNSPPTGCVGCAEAANAKPIAGSATSQSEPKGGDLSLPGSTPSTYAQNRVGPRMNLENPLPYDLLLQNGHVIDAKNKRDGVMDVALKDGKVAAVGEHLNAKDAAKTIDVKGLIVTPGIVDIHTHVYASTGEASLAGDESVWPDGFTFRTGVTTIVDAGSSGWRNFEDFKEHIIDRSKTRVLAELNIVGAGMRGPKFEDNLADMDGVATGAMAKRYPGVVVGIKSAHYAGPEWEPYIQAVKAGTIANIPVMIDYGANRIERPLGELLTKYLRPGDIYTHAYSGFRGEQDTKTLKASAAMKNGRAHGVYFDAGTGGGSLRFALAVPLIKDGFKPDSLSTDLHTGSMNGGTKDMLNVMSAFMAAGLTLQEVVADSTWNPAREVKQEQLGNLSVGAPADVAVLNAEHGSYGFMDADNRRLRGDTRLICELTVRNGKIVYDLNGISSDDWDKPLTSDPKVGTHWTAYPPKPLLPAQVIPTGK